MRSSRYSWRGARAGRRTRGRRLIALSTPYGQRGWWYKAWRAGEGWERYEVPAPECPRFSAASLEEERASLPAREYLCEFAETQDAVFSYADTQGVLSDAVVPFFGAPNDGPPSHRRPRLVPPRYPGQFGEQLCLESHDGCLR